jgi:hypothetical protein
VDQFSLSISSIKTVTNSGDSSKEEATPFVTDLTRLRLMFTGRPFAIFMDTIGISFISLPTIMWVLNISLLLKRPAVGRAFFLRKKGTDLFFD